MKRLLVPLFGLVALAWAQEPAQLPGFPPFAPPPEAMLDIVQRTVAEHGGAEAGITFRAEIAKYVPSSYTSPARPTGV